MAIPTATREQLLAALATFDREYRDTVPWRNWEQQDTYKWALVENGRRYPVKQIIRIATGADTGFNAGEARAYVQRLGFPVESLEAPAVAPGGAAQLDRLERVVGQLGAAAGDAKLPEDAEEDPPEASTGIEPLSSLTLEE